MIKTLLIYDGRMSSAERIADKLCYLIGNAMVSEITEAPSDLTPYDGFCFVFNFYGAVSAGRTRAYIARHIDELGGRRIIMVGIGFSDLGYTKFVSDSELMTGVGSISGIFISSEAETLRVGYEISRILHEPVHEVEEHKLQDKIEDFIRQHRSLALATAASGYLRCTPLAYMYLDHVFYVITEGGYKFRGILENGDASAAIYDELPEDGSRIASLQILCKAAPVPVGSDEYYTAMAAGGMTKDKLDAMPITLFLLKIVPLRYEYLDTDLAREGYDTKQILDTEFRRKTWEAGAAYASAEEAREAAMASEKLKEEASRANADGGSALRIPDVLEEETPETDAVREAAVEAANAEARQEAGIVVKEIFTEVDEEANVGEDISEEDAEIHDADVTEENPYGDREEAADSDAYGDEEIIDSDEYGDEEIIDSDEYGDEEIIDSGEYGDEEVVDSDAYEVGEELTGLESDEDEEDGLDTEAYEAAAERRDTGNFGWNYADTGSWKANGRGREPNSFIRSPEIDTAHLPEIDMTVLGGSAYEEDEDGEDDSGFRSGRDDEEGVYSVRDDGEDEEGVYSIRDEEEEERKNRRFGLAELEAMEEEDDAAYEKRKRQRREARVHEEEEEDEADVPASEADESRAEEDYDEAVPDDEDGDAEEDGERPARRRSRRQSSGRSGGKKREKRRRTSSGGGFFARLGRGLSSLLKIDDNEDDLEEE